MRRVVITGIGVISPIGIGASAFWANLLAGQIGVRKVASLDPGGFQSQIAGETPPFKIGDYVPKSYRKATKVMARDIELAVIAADDAFKDAGLKSRAYTDAPTINPTRFGCNIGAGLISCDLTELTYAMNAAREGNKLSLQKWGVNGMDQLTPLWLLKYLPNMLACHVTIIHDLKGPSNTITCADASGHLAIGEAFRTIQRGKADLAICGGAESKVNHMGLMRHSLLKRLNVDSNDAPERSVRPFDASAQGTALGEGGGLFILEEFEHAKKRDAKIYAELVGFGASQDTYSVSEPDPSGHSYAAAVKKALAEAKVTPDEIGCLIPHGIGLASHDAAELAGLRAALGSSLETIPFAPLKGQLSNLAAACGVDAAAAVLSLHHQKIPAAINLTKPAGGAKLNFAPTPRDASFNVSVSSIYSLGGQNATLVFRKI